MCFLKKDIMKKIAICIIVISAMLLCACEEDGSILPEGTHGKDDFSLVREDVQGDYVLNVSSKKVHLLSCSYAKRISEENRREVSDPDQAYREGYVMCAYCLKQDTESATQDTKEEETTK